MPEICRFYGIVIQIYYGDHPPAHFHAVYGEHVAKIAIDTLQIIEGSIPARALSLVREWVTLQPRGVTTGVRARRKFSIADEDCATSLSDQSQTSSSRYLSKRGSASARASSYTRGCRIAASEVYATGTDVRELLGLATIFLKVYFFLCDSWAKIPFRIDAYFGSYQLSPKELASISPETKILAVFVAGRVD